MTSDAYAIINLAAARHNLEKVKSYAPNAKIMAVIKADAYGHGLLRIAQAISKVDALAVARIAEGIALRQAGIENKITILGGFVCQKELDELMKYNLDCVVHSVEQVDILENYQAQEQIAIGLKLDSGMNRLGFKSTEFESVYQRLLSCACVEQPFSLLTHLSSADDLTSQVTLQQIALFREAVKKTTGDKSIANSAAIIAWPESLTDWVRPGIMLYGVSPFEVKNKKGEDLGLKPVMSLHSRLVAIKTIEAGEAVGYAGTWVSDKKMKLGVVAIGYGDGYPRHAKPGTPVLVNGERVALIGRVSMDMITVDLSGKNAKLGDPVILWGEGLAIEEIANYSSTIPYTLLCGVTQRVERVNIKRQ